MSHQVKDGDLGKRALLGSSGSLALVGHGVNEQPCH